MRIFSVLFFFILLVSFAPQLAVGQANSPVPLQNTLQPPDSYTGVYVAPNTGGISWEDADFFYRKHKLSSGQTMIIWMSKNPAARVSVRVKTFVNGWFSSVNEYVQAVDQSWLVNRYVANDNGRLVLIESRKLERTTSNR